MFVCLATFLVCGHLASQFFNCSLSWSLPDFGGVFVMCAHLVSAEGQ